MTNPIDDVIFKLLAFAVVFGVLVFFHELGHFLVARLFGVGVDKFSLGFGRRLWGKKVGRTDYCISIIPLGGYVKMVGEEPDAEISPEDMAVSFTHANVFKRMGIVAAGPIFNLLLAIAIFFVVILMVGVQVLKPVVGQTLEGMPAQKAGIQAGDVILSIDGKKVETWQEMVEIVTLCNGKTLEIELRRGETDLVVSLTPHTEIEKKFGAEIKRYLIGIMSAERGFYKKVSIPEAATASVYEAYKQTKLIFVFLGRLISGEESSKNIGGPILIAQIAGHQAEKGVGNLVLLIAMLSIMLAIFNILPIPILDGGLLLFFAIEAVIRRPLNAKMREMAQLAGLFLLVMITVLAFYNDITRVFNS